MTLRLNACYDLLGISYGNRIHDPQKVPSHGCCYEEDGNKAASNLTGTDLHRKSVGALYIMGSSKIAASNKPGGGQFLPNAPNGTGGAE
uniref:Uncharacterized protein n=1 Tax=Romanomermis culicivorax TaxID=13658 RepID=A0A915JTR5_ROMCU